MLLISVRPLPPPEPGSTDHPFCDYCHRDHAIKVLVWDTGIELKACGTCAVGGG